MRKRRPLHLAAALRRRWPLGPDQLRPPTDTIVLPGIDCMPTLAEVCNKVEFQPR